MNYAEILLTIAPVFLLIVLGYILRRADFPGSDFWARSDRLVYWLLFPALLFSTTSTMSFAGDAVFTYALIVYSGFGGAVIFALIVRQVLGMEGPLATSLLQGSARHNTFMALAIAERLLGNQGLATAVLTSALLIPITNIVVVTLMVILLQHKSSASVLPAILRDLARNPLLIAILMGIGVNRLGIAPIPIVNEMAAILGRAGLPIMLLGVGASIRVRRMGAVGAPVLLSIAGKMVAFPLGIVLAARMAGLPAATATVALIYGAVPTAASSYTLARQMGGDAEAMSAMITVQTAVSFLSLPLTLAIVSRM